MPEPTPSYEPITSEETPDTPEEPREGASEEKPEEQPPAPPAGGAPPEVVISVGDMRDAEKAQLKLMLAVKDEQLAQVNLAQAAEVRRAAKEASDRIREEIEEKYGIDLMKFDIDEKSGKLIPKKQSAINPALLQQLMGNMR